MPTLLLLATLHAAPLLQQPAEPAAADSPAPPPPTWRGSFVPAPADALAIEIWPESWSGEWLLLEVAPHGSFVHDGQVIARFDPGPLAEARDRAERELDDARTDQRAAVARAELESQADAERLAAAVSALARARRAFQGWREIELAMRREQAALQDLYAQHGIEDAEDELEQLEAMYGADELADATEELVLMRNRRDLARSRTQLDMARRQRAYTEEFAWAAEDQEKEEALQRQEAGLERTRSGLELDMTARRERLARAEQALARQERDLERLRADAKHLEVRAPREGLLLHGAAQDYEPGRTPPRHARGDRTTVRRPLFTLTGGTRFIVALEVGAMERAALVPGAAVEVRCPGLPDFVRPGRMEVEAFPLARSGAGAEAVYAAVVTLDAELRGIAPGMRAEVKLAQP